MKCILPLAIHWVGIGLPQTNIAQQPKIVTAAQVNGTWRYSFGKSRSGTIRILALGKQRLKVEFIGLYTYPLADGTKNTNTNMGEGQSIAIIEGNQATFKPNEAEKECLITMNFTRGVLEVEQKGSCGFGLNVTLAGTYRRVSSRKPKFVLDYLYVPNDKPCKLENRENAPLGEPFDRRSLRSKIDRAGASHVQLQRTRRLFFLRHPITSASRYIGLSKHSSGTHIELVSLQQAAVFRSARRGNVGWNGREGKEKLVFSFSL
jgi:hypothetical protein